MVVAVGGDFLRSSRLWKALSIFVMRSSCRTFVSHCLFNTRRYVALFRRLKAFCGLFSYLLIWWNYLKDKTTFHICYYSHTMSTTQWHSHIAWRNHTLKRFCEVKWVHLASRWTNTTQLPISWKMMYFRCKESKWNWILCFYGNEVTLRFIQELWKFTSVSQFKGTIVLSLLFIVIVNLKSTGVHSHDKPISEAWCINLSNWQKPKPNFRCMLHST